MAWVKRIRTASGATGVQVWESVGGKRRLVAHVGSARDEFELGLLLDQAEQIMAGPGQDALDIGAISRQVSALVAEPSDQLFADNDKPVLASSAVASGTMVVATASDLLFDVLSSVYADLGFDQVGDEVFRDLVVARIVKPTSLLAVDLVLESLGRRSASFSTRRRTLERCYDGSYRDQLAELAFAYAQAHSDISTVFYDVTTLRTAAEREDSFRRVGFSKDRSIDPQVTVGLLTDRCGIPLEIAAFEGNRAEKLTLIPVLTGFKDRHGIENLVVVADAGMLSATNCAALDDAGFYFILGSRATKAPLDLEAHYRWHGTYMTDGQIIDTLTPKVGKNCDRDPAVRAEPVWDPESHPGSWRAIWTFSTKRFMHDNKVLRGQLERAQNALTGERPARKPRFLKASKTGYTFDQVTYDRAVAIAGTKGYVTNVPASLMPATEVMADYHNLWRVEETIKISKSDLKARPLFARRRQAIEAHLTVVLAALAVVRVAQQRSGITIRRIIETLEPLRSATLTSNGIQRTIPPAISPEQHQLITALTGKGD